MQQEKVYLTYKKINKIDKQLLFKKYLMGAITEDELALQLKNTGEKPTNKTFYTTPEKATLHPADIKKLVEIATFVTQLNFPTSSTNLTMLNKDKYYVSFSIPKRSGGLRQIDAPTGDLKDLQFQLKTLLEKNQLFHPAACAYIKHKSTKDAINVHQQNESKWFLKIDLKDFFGSHTKDYITTQLKNTYPFHKLTLQERETIAELATYNNKLPQGTPVSPILTNILFTPYDFEIATSKALAPLIYTRYADDLLFSSKEPFNPKHVINVLKTIFKETPYTINPSKVRYGSRNGSNWNLGLMLNKDNNITLGHENKQKFRATINNFLLKLTQNEECSMLEAQQLMGIISYYSSVEPEYTAFCIHRLEQRYNNQYKVLDKLKTLSQNTQ